MKKNISFYYGFDSEYHSRVDLLKEVGFDGVMAMYEYAPDFYESIEYALKQGLEIESIHLPFRNMVNDLWVEGDGGEKYTTLMIEGGKYAKEIGVKKLTIHLSSSYTPPPMSEIGFKRLQKIYEFYLANDLTLCIENLRRIDYFRAVVELFPKAKICYDVGHHNIYYPDTFDILDYKDRVELLHLHDNYGQKDDHYLPFEGSCDWQKICANIAKMPAVNSLTLEVHGSIDEKNMATERGYLTKAMESALKIERMIKGC